MAVTVHTDSENAKKLLADHRDNMAPAVTIKKIKGRPCIGGRMMFVVTSCLLLLLCLLLVVFIYVLLTKGKVIPQPFCCECSELAFLGNMGENGKSPEKSIQNDKLYCCVKSQEQYMTIMHGMQEKMKTRTILTSYLNTIPSLLNSSVVGAHVLGGFEASAFQKNTRESNERGRLPIIKLLPERSLSLLKQVTCERDRIIIHSKGVYLVYSQLYMKAIRGTNWPEGWKLLVHVVERYNQYLPNGGEEKLLQSVHTLTESTEHKGTSIDFHTSYTTGVFELEEGDELYVRVNSTDVVSRYPTLNYIGVVRLSNVTDSKDI